MVTRTIARVVFLISVIAAAGCGGEDEGVSGAPGSGGSGGAGGANGQGGAGGADGQGGAGGTGGQAETPQPVEDWSRDLLSTSLMIDVEKLSATASIQIAPSESTGLSLDVAGLSITGVKNNDGPLAYEVKPDGKLNVGVPSGGVGGSPATVIIDYTFKHHNEFDGFMESGTTMLWPYFCGNLFPCKSDPTDGLTFDLALTGVPVGKTAVYPAMIPGDGPSYMIAWAIGDYTKIDLGKTEAGTQIVAWHLAGGEMDAQKGTAHLREIFSWYEKTYGPYLFGPEAGSVSADWGPGAYGGMEHHPLWHVAIDAMADEETHAHEAAHGWFGDGVRIACWEDFVLSEGTVSYLAARAIGEVVGAAEEQVVWDGYTTRLDKAMAGSTPKIAWPSSCGEVDILNDGLFSTIPYMKGAFFFRALELKIGKAALDAAIRAFYIKYQEKAAGMQDLLDEVKAVTGYDPEVCAAAWLKAEPVPADPACP